MTPLNLLIFWLSPLTFKSHRLTSLSPFHSVDLDLAGCSEVPPGGRPGSDGDFLVSQGHHSLLAP